MPHTIKNQAGEPKSDAVTLMTYFGRSEGQTVAGFMEEVRAPKPKDKDELAVGAAKELGWKVEVVE